MQNILWTAEIKFQFLHSERNFYVRIKTGDRLNDECALWTDKHGSASVMGVSFFCRGGGWRFDSDQVNHEKRIKSFVFTKTYNIILFYIIGNKSPFTKSTMSNTSRLCPKKSSPYKKKLKFWKWWLSRLKLLIFLPFN